MIGAGAIADDHCTDVNQYPGAEVVAVADSSKERREAVQRKYNMAKAYWYRRTGSPKFGTWFVNKKLAGGGCMLDIGVHFLDLALFLADNWKPVSVSGKVYTKFVSVDVCDNMGG